MNSPKLVSGLSALFLILEPAALCSQRSIQFRLSSHSPNDNFFEKKKRVRSRHAGISRQFKFWFAILLVCVFASRGKHEQAEARDPTRDKVSSFVAFTLTAFPCLFGRTLLHFSAVHFSLTVRLQVPANHNSSHQDRHTNTHRLHISAEQIGNISM